MTGTEGYKRAALRAGAWSYDNLYVNMEYRGGTCDNLDIMDKEAGIYALFAFLSLYDLTQEGRWLEAACGAADYVETFTYVWNYPIVTPYPCMPFNKNHISGQSPVTVGTGGGDIYMASCSYVTSPVLLTGDDHIRDFAEFHQPQHQAGERRRRSVGYNTRASCTKGGFFSGAVIRGVPTAPWCTYVEVDPAWRLTTPLGVRDRGLRETAAGGAPSAQRDLRPLRLSDRGGEERVLVRPPRIPLQDRRQAAGFPAACRGLGMRTRAPGRALHVIQPKNDLGVRVADCPARRR